MRAYTDKETSTSPLFNAVPHTVLQTEAVHSSLLHERGQCLRRRCIPPLNHTYSPPMQAYFRLLGC